MQSSDARRIGPMAAAALFLSTTPAWAQADAAMNLPIWWYFAPLGAVVALVMAWRFYASVMTASEGDESMIRIAQAVREGAYAYLRSQWRVVAVVFVILLVILALMGFVMGLQSRLTFVGVGIAGFLSGLCGFFGMKMATNASARTAHAAKQSLDSGLRVAFRAGAVMGLCVTGFALLDVSFWYFLLVVLIPLDGPVTITTVILSFAMGASLQALFARVGGGIYTKAADVGADLVGKVEAGIPEDDARNPATIADNVGDNVGDVAGMGADLYESYYGSILASSALAAAAAFQLGLGAPEAMRLVAAPAAIAGLGILCSIACIFVVRAKEGATMGQLLKSLHSGVWASSVLIIILAAVLLHLLIGGEAMREVGISAWGIWGAIVAGTLAGLVIAWGTEYYTSYEHAPTRRISKQAETGPATVIIAGVAEGMISTWVPLLTVVAAILVSFISAGGNEAFLLGVFGVGIAAVGMLSTLAITLATDAYGPIADNAGGNAEMTHQEPYVRERTDMLDSLGNTTAATGKGFAIGSAALTALALLAAYVITVQASLSAQVRVDLVEAPERVTYIAHGLFEVGVDGEPDAGLLVTAGHRARIERLLAESPGLEPGEPGEPTPAAEAEQAVEASPAVAFATFDEEARLFHGVMRDPDTGQRHTFQVVPASTATLPQLMAYYDVTIMNPRVLCGLFLGVMLVFVFCAMTMNAVGRAAFRMMQECRRQFGIMKEAFLKQGMSEADVSDPMKWPYEVDVDGKRYPDYANCVAISTQGALREMVAPSLLAVIVPIVVGLILGVAGVMGLLAGALVSGFAVAIFMANAGGAWDNAKKWIETGHHGGKGSEAHKAGVVGDTVGDPFKDTSGPSLNILIKLISVVSVVFAAAIVRYSPPIAAALGIG